MDINWIVAKASAIGKSHIEENLPCQDSHGYTFFNEENFGLAVVADGAGSAEFSNIGSSKVVEQAIEKFGKLIREEKIYSTPPEEKIWKTYSIAVFKDIFTEIKRFAENEKINYKSLAATAIVVGIMPYGIIATHIGDGRAGYLNEKGDWISCITPFKGELVNETVFITSDFWEKEDLEQFIESKVIEDSIRAFALLSDGCENVCFELNRLNAETQYYEKVNNPYPGFFDHNIQVLKSLHWNGVTETEIDFMWQDFLKNGLEGFVNEPDDKTLLLGVKIESINDDIIVNVNDK